MLIALAIFITSCAFATIVTLAAGVLSSRINRAQPVMEKYETVSISQNSHTFTQRTYPIEINM